MIRSDMRLLNLIVVSGLSVRLLSAQTEFLKPQGIAPATGYSHAVVVQTGKLVFVSGQIANNAQGVLVGKGDLKAQTEQVFQNLRAALAAAGSSFEHVVKINWYIRDYTPAALPVIRAVRDRYVNPAAPPASTLVGVAALFHPDYLLEVEVTAVVPEPGAHK